MKFSTLLAAGLAVLDSAYAVQSNDNSVSTSSSLISHPSNAHHSSSSHSLPHSHKNSTAAFIRSSQTPHVVVPPTITKDPPHSKHTPATDKASKITTKSTHTQHDPSGRISEASKEPVHTPIHTPSGSSSANPKTNTPVTSSTKPNTKTNSTTPTDTGASNTNTPKNSSKADDKTSHKTHHTSHPEHTTDPSTTHDPAHLTTPSAAHFITAPAQSSVKTGDFSTKTLSDHTGPPSSYTATTVTGHDHHSTILPVWFNKKGHAIMVSPVKTNGPPGIIPPPKGLPKLSIGADGNPTPDPSNDDPPKTKNPKTTKKPDDHTSKAHDNTASEKTSKKTTSTSSKSSSTSTTTTSTSTPTGESTKYLIVPKQDSTQKQHKKLTSKLIDMVGKSKVKTKSFKMDGLGYWSATLNSTQVEEIKKESIIEGVVKDEIITVKGIGGDNKKTKRTDGKGSFRNLVRSAKFWKRNDPVRDHAPLELALISQPKDNSISRDTWGGTYQYDGSAGKGITVYVVDTGASPHNNEYKNMPGKKSWIYPGALGINHHDTNQDDKIGHGTCVLSKLAGPKFGVAKNVDIVVVKLQGDHTKDSKGNPAFAIYGQTYLDAVQSIIYDIKSNKRQGKAIVNMSFGLPIDNMFYAQLCERNTKMITDLDVPIIVAAGNDATEGAKQVNTYPGLWAKKNDGIIVVGSTSDSNQISKFSQDGPLVTVYAPGENIVCAAPGQGDAEKHEYGTSFAAPAVAGLTAYLMALPGNNHLPKVGSGKIPGFLHSQLKDHASWPREKGGPNIIWNGASWGNQDCDSDIDLIEKRNSGSHKCSASATTGGTKTKTNTASKETPHSTKSTKSTKASHTPTPTTKGTTTSHHTTPAKTTHATTTSSKAPTKPTKPTPASLWCAPTHKPSATIPADKAHGKVESFCKGILDQGGAINGFYPMSHNYKEYKKTYKFGDADTTFNLNWVKGYQAGITVNMCKDMLSEVIDGCSDGYGGGIPHKGIPTGVASFNVTLGKDE